jgi:hypothetical protein
VTSTVATIETSSLPTATGPLHAVVPDQPLLAHGSVEAAAYLFVSVEEAVHAYIIGFRGVDGLDLDLNHPRPMWYQIPGSLNPDFSTT